MRSRFRIGAVALACALTCGCSHGTTRRPAPLKILSGPFNWSIATVPPLPRANSNVRLMVVVRDRLYLLPVHVDYGDGSGADYQGGGPSCAGVPPGYTPVAPSGPVVEPRSDASSLWNHVYAHRGRFTVTVTYRAPCPSAGNRVGSAALGFDVH